MLWFSFPTIIYGEEAASHPNVAINVVAGTDITFDCGNGLYSEFSTGLDDVFDISLDIITTSSVNRDINLRAIESMPIPIQIECIKNTDHGHNQFPEQLLVVLLGPWVSPCAHCNAELIFDASGLRTEYFYLRLSNTDGIEIYHSLTLNYGVKFETLEEWLGRDDG